MSTITKTVPAAASKEAPAKHKKPPRSARARAERRLGWLLCGPAVIVLIGVAAYPICYSVYLSLQKYNLAFPHAVKFVGLSNYGAVLSSPYWWQALKVTVIITVLSVAHVPDGDRPRPHPHDCPHPVRDRDRRRRVRLAVCVDPQ